MGQISSGSGQKELRPRVLRDSRLARQGDPGTRLGPTGFQELPAPKPLYPDWA